MFSQVFNPLTMEWVGRP